MPARPPRPAYNRWRDVDGAHLPEQCRIEQVAVSKEHGALPSRLHKQGQVVGRGVNRLSVRFQGEDQPTNLRPHLVRLLDAPDGR